MGAALKKRRTIIGSKGGSATQKQPSIATNSVPSLATARIVYLWSWGPIVGPVNGLKSIKLDGTQVQADDGTLNFPNVKWQFRSGELNQPRLEGIAEASNEITVNQQLISTTPWLYSVTNPSLNAVRVRFGWPQLQSQDSSGNINGVRIEYAIDVSTDSGPFTTVLTSFVDRKNVTKYERSHRIELPSGGRWSVRVRRLTAEANSSLVQDGMLIEAIAEVVYSDQEYPLTAVSALEYDAQQFGGDIAKVAVLMRGRIVRVPANYDAATRTYSTGGSGTTNGIWDGTFKEAYTNNPAWVFYDLVLHPYYGLGERIDATMVDRFALYRIAQYCDQMVSDGNGGMEPRFACNLYLQKQEEAYAVLQDLASIFHGLAFWDGSQIVVNADMPGDPVYTYNPSQILNDGAIQYSGTRWRDRHTLAMVSWDNPALGFDTDKEPVFDEDAMAEIGSVRDLSVAAFGCTTQGQAQRAGMWALMTEQLQTRGGKFAVGLDGQIPRPGQVIAVADPMFAGRANGGRISAVAGRAITLDREVTLPSGARLLCNLPSGKSEARMVKSVVGRVVTVMADYSEVPQAESGWAMDYDDLKLMQFYVRNITRPEWHQYQFELIQHEPSKFDAIDSGAVIDTRPISVLPIGVQAAPATVIIGQHVVIEQGIAVTVMTIAWASAAGAVGYDVEWRWGAREWIKVPRTGELSVDVRGIYSGQYLARVRAVNSMGVSSLPTSSTLTQLNGKNGLPPAVTFLTATSLLFGIGLKWGFPAGAEDTQRTELWYGPTTDLAAATKLTDLAYPQNDYSMQSLLAGASFFFWARLVDRTGNIGPWYPVGNGVLGQASSDAGPILDQIAGQISETELGQQLASRIDLIDGPASLAGSVANQVATEATARAQADATEAQTRAAADAANATAITKEATDRASAILTEAQTRQAAVTSETTARQSADTSLGQRIDTVTASNGTNAAAIQSEATARTTADSALGTRIDTVAASTASNLAAIGTEVTARTSADSALGVRIDTVVATATTDRTTLNAAVVSEATARANGDTALGSRVDTVSATVAGKADTSAVNSLAARVTTAEGTITSQGTSITGLNSSLVTTNSNVTTAQNAANAANTLAGGKGKVLVQTTTPIAADQLVQNLWIDITGGNNTPKRWNGSAWAAVTDKVATDAAAAAANALSVANTKADASAVNSLTTRVTSAEGTISSQGTALTSLSNSLTTTNTNVAAAQTAATNAATLAGGKGKVLVQSTTPVAADQLPQNLWIDITSNANTPKRWDGSAWTAVSDKVATDAATAAAAAIALVASKADASAVSALTTRVSSVEGVITSQADSVMALRASARSDDGEGDLADALQGYNANASFTQEVTVRASADEALSQRITTFDATLGQMSANITDLEQVVVTSEAATAQAIQTLSATVGENSSAIQTTATAYADTAGKLTTMWSIKMQVASDGKYVAAGVGLGIENTDAGLQSQFIVSADRFAIVNTIAGGAASVPFAVQGGQVFLGSAFIRDGTITNAKIGSYISSTNYIAGQQGWILNKDGTLEINGVVAGGGKLVITNRSVRVYDASNVKRVQLGDLSE